jgi:hypothetical protein
MKNRITYVFNQQGSSKGRTPEGPDPRLLALVRFMARRAAERDFFAHRATPQQVLILEREKDKPK